MDWDPILETGNKRIDSQHKMLIGIYNDLVAALRSGKGGDEITKSVEFLASYVYMHFMTEEALQVITEYPDYPRHKTLHDEFKQAIADFVDRLNKEGPTDEFVASFTRAVDRWLINHVKGEDFRMAAFVKATGSG